MNFWKFERWVFGLTALLPFAEVASAGQPESLRAFLDSRAEASVLSDKKEVRSTPTGERLVRLYGPLNGFYSSSVPSIMGATSAQLGAAGSRDTRTGLRVGDPRHSPGMLQLSQRKLGTLRDTEAAYEWFDTDPRPADAIFGGWRWRTSVGQTEQDEVVRRDAAVRVQTSLGDSTVFALGLSARQWRVPVAQLGENVALAQAGLAWLAPDGRAQASASVLHPLSSKGADAGHAARSDASAHSAMQLAATVRLGTDWSAYASATNATGLLLTDSMRLEEAWRARVGVHWAHKGSANGEPSSGAGVYSELRSGTLANATDTGLAMGWRDDFALNAHWRLSTFAEAAHLLSGTSPFDGVRGGVGLQRDFDGQSQLEATLEVAHGDAGDSQRATGKYTLKVDPQSVLALRASVAYAQRGNTPFSPLGSQSQLAQVKTYWVWRAPQGAYVSVAIAAYTDDKMLRPDPAHLRVWVLSEQVRYTPMLARSAGNRAQNGGLFVPTELAVRVALRRSDNVTTGQRRLSQMLLGRASWRLAPLWQLSTHAAAVGGAIDTERYALGAEASYQMGRVVDLAFGYNVRGFRDADLQAEDRLTPGAYIRLRFEFDKALARWYR